LQPIPADATIIKQAFIDREDETNKIKHFIGLRVGRLLVLGRIGEGKSSLLNVAEQLATDNGIMSIRIDGSTSNNLERIVEMLLHVLTNQLEDVNPETISQLGKTLKELDVEEVTEEEKDRIEGTIEGSLGAFIAAIKSKITGASEKGRKIVYRPKTLVRTDRILQDILPSLLRQLRVLLIMDDTEKLQEDNFKSAVEAIDRLPQNILLIATANYEEIGQSNMQLCYRVFDDQCMMRKIDEASLSKFVKGRLDSFAVGGTSRINIDSRALAALHERTLGNLRDTFRYCYRALEANRTAITKAMMIKAIGDVDAPKFAALEQIDRILLASLSKSGKSRFDELLRKLPSKKEVGSPMTIRRRLDDLATLDLLRRKRVKQGRTYVMEYSIPNVLLEAIRSNKLLE